MKKGSVWRIVIIVLITIADVAYQIWPADAINDVVPFLGQLDDSLGVIINVIAAFKLSAGRYKSILEERNN